MKLDEWDFQGPYKNPDDIWEAPGVYVVLCLSPDNSLQVLDIGESGWGRYPDSQGMRKRLTSHSRRPCWEQNCRDGEIAFVVLYEENGEKRLEVEQKLRLKYQPPCGTTPSL